MEFETALDNFNSSLWGHHINVPKSIAEEVIEGNDRRIECTIESSGNSKYTFQCALMPKGDGNYFINVNKEIRTKLKLKEGMKVNAKIVKDKSKYGLPVPEEFTELLYQDPEGEKLFSALTMGKQRSLIHIVGKPKGADTRLKKALVILDFLKTNNGKLDFKMLNQAFKDANKHY